MDGIVDFAPLVEILIGFIAVLLSGLATLISRSLTKWIGVKKDSELMIQIDSIINRGIDNVADRLRDKGVQKFNDVTIKNEIVEQVLEYTLRIAPKAVKDLGVEESLREFVESNVRQWVRFENESDVIESQVLNEDESPEKE